MDVAAASMQMSTAALHQQISLSVLKMTMDTVEDMAQVMVDELLTQAMPSGVEGAVIDIAV